MLGALLRHDLLKARLLSHGDRLTPTAYRVASFIDENRATVLAASAADLAASLGTSDATIVRAVQALGFSGIPEMKRELAVSLKGGTTPSADMGRTLSDIGGDTDKAIDHALSVHAEAVANEPVLDGVGATRAILAAGPERVAEIVGARAEQVRAELGAEIG